ncbi:hypothetical protein GCM10009677_34130 [Sphaerisporangium rubeum]
MSRAVVRKKLTDSHPALDTATLLVSEIVTNAIIHSDTKNGGKITLSLADCHDFIHIEVTEAGGDEYPHIRDDEWSEGGRGLRIVQTLATRWGVRQDPTGRTVWLQTEYKNHPERPTPHAHTGTASPRQAP